MGRDGSTLRTRVPTQAWAARFIEKHERSARAWYGGAVGHIAFDGSLNTGLTLRTIHYADGVASVRAGATLLYDSDPVAEEAETELKASAMLGALRSTAAGESPAPVEPVVEGFNPEEAGIGKRVLLVDHEDSLSTRSRITCGRPALMSRSRGVGLRLSTRLKKTAPGR